MTTTEQIVVFFMSWWIVLLMVLPFGAQTVEEAGETLAPGIERGAPARPRLLLKMGITTLITLGISLLFWIADKYNLVTLKDFYN